jgi:hypothetical protein
MHTVWRDRAAKQLVWRTRVGVAEFSGWIAEWPYDILFERRWCLRRRRGSAEFKTPRLVDEWFGRCAGYGSSGSGRACDGKSLSK